MKERRAALCPFLIPVVADRLWLQLRGGYCRRPDGRVRAPARTTILQVCTTPRHLGCAGYRAAMAASTDADWMRGGPASASRPQ